MHDPTAPGDATPVHRHPAPVDTPGLATPGLVAHERSERLATRRRARLFVALYGACLVALLVAGAWMAPAAPRRRSRTHRRGRLETSTATVRPTPARSSSMPRLRPPSPRNDLLGRRIALAALSCASCSPRARRWRRRRPASDRRARPGATAPDDADDDGAATSAPTNRRSTGATRPATAPRWRHGCRGAAARRRRLLGRPPAGPRGRGVAPGRRPDRHPRRLRPGRVRAGRRRSGRVVTSPRVAEATSHGSGDEVDVAGDAVLTVDLVGVLLPMDAPAGVQTLRDDARRGAGWRRRGRPW